MNGDDAVCAEIVAIAAAAAAVNSKASLIRTGRPGGALERGGEDSAPGPACVRFARCGKAGPRARSTRTRSKFRSDSQHSAQRAKSSGVDADRGRLADAQCDSDLSPGPLVDVPHPDDDSLPRRQLAGGVDNCSQLLAQDCRLERIRRRAFRNAHHPRMVPGDGRQQHEVRRIAVRLSGLVQSTTLRRDWPRSSP